MKITEKDIKFERDASVAIDRVPNDFTGLAIVTHRAGPATPLLRFFLDGMAYSPAGQRQSPSSNYTFAPGHSATISRGAKE